MVKIKAKRFSPPAGGVTGHRTSLLVPGGMLDAVHMAMEEKGYSSKKRGLWINESISSLFELNFESVEEIVGEEFMSDLDNSRIPLTLSSQNKAVIDSYKKEYTNDLSSIVRTAITQRLIMGL
jgi:hypothetical protein